MQEKQKKQTYYVLLKFPRIILDWKTRISKQQLSPPSATEFLLLNYSRQICFKKKSICEDRHRNLCFHSVIFWYNMPPPKHRPSDISTFQIVPGHSKFQLVHKCMVSSLQTLYMNQCSVEVHYAFNFEA